ncbi:putative iron-dependent peroxidase [Oceanisphaera litoralis]|uniref:Dyp-type peroxidase n=1 Tax=Oceanisphaera litoralis TaxID=225144 RepID=UPI0019598BB4|nr:Dyp-type peroxidase [Oceanisphaera litoralis]MBM7455777.1 putative iron-dependent peroxidase [Oceanisphaera litoralis]
MTAQAGICAEPNLHAHYLMFEIRPHRFEAVRAALAEIPALWQGLRQDYPDAAFSGVVAVGNEAWDELYPGARPAELMPFPAQQQGQRIAPETPFDLFFQLRADRLDVAYIAVQRVMALLAGKVELQEERQGFRYLDGRDMTGFVDGTENPQGDDRAEVALVGEGRFADGSYLHVQRYRHKMTRWQKLAVKAQEDIYGRTKSDNIEYESARKAPTAHTRRTSLKDAAGNGMEILRQSMPWGTAAAQGLVFVSCCHTPLHFTRMLENMYQPDDAGHFDHLTLFTQAETGAAFFAPSEEWLAMQGDL